MSATPPEREGGAAPDAQRGPARGLAWRLGRVVAVTLVWVALFEGAAWGADAVWGFRAQLLEGLSLIEPSQAPIEPLASLPWSEDMLMVRAPDPAHLRRRPYVLGGRRIPNAMVRPKQTLVLSKLAASDPRKQVFVVGGSAAFGYTTLYRQAFATLLGQQLGATHNVFNVAQVGWPSGHVVNVVRRVCAHFRPSALIVMAGNNEWLRWVPRDQPWLSAEQLDRYRTLAQSRLLAGVLYLGLNRAVTHADVPDAPDTTETPAARAASAETDATGRGAAGATADEAAAAPFAMHHSLYGFAYALAHPADRDAPYETSRWLEEKRVFLAAFEAHLREMVTLGKAKGARVLLLTIPFNHRLNIAWKHPQPEAPQAATRDAVKALLKTAVPLVQAGSCTAALIDLDAAVALDATSPLVHYLRGTCLERLGRTQPERKLEAEAAYAQAREHMVGNLGSRLSVNRVIRRVAKDTASDLVDVAAVFTAHERSRDGYFNEHLIDDDCHPNALGQRLIATAVAEVLAKP